jgi:hypothetical protein
MQGARNSSPRSRLRARGLKSYGRQLFRWRGRRKRVGGDRDCVRLPAEASPSHADIPEQPHPSVRLFEVRRELPIDLERPPIVLLPGLEHRMEFVRQLGPHRQRRAAARRVDGYASLPVELEAMAAWNVVKPAMSVFEIGRLKPKRGDHWRDVQGGSRGP